MPTAAIPKQRRSSAKARWGWSGFTMVPDLRDQETQLRAIVTRMPARRSSIIRLTKDLRDLGGRYQRYLQQDELGPTRAERLAALRALISQIDALADALGAIPRPLRQELANAFDETAVPDLSYAPLFYYDLAAAGRIADAVDRLRTRLERQRRNADALEGLAPLAREASGAVALLATLDSTSHGDVFMIGAGKTPKPLGKNEWSDPLAGARAGLGRTRQRAMTALARLERTKGAEPVISLRWLVIELCELWRREVRAPRVTVDCVGHQSKPISEAGQFLLDLFDAFEPTVTPGAAATTKRAIIFEPRNRKLRIGRIDRAVREYVRSRPKQTRRGPPRKAQ